MTPKLSEKQSDSTIRSPGAAGARQSQDENSPIVEVAVVISVPPVHGGVRAWMVLFGAFTSVFIMDGSAFTFGSILPDISKELKVSDSLVALINSTSCALYFLASPLASAFINRYGFRKCIMTGSIISSLSLCCSYFMPNYGYLFIFYGITAAFGYSLINMSSNIVVGFYFEKLRSLALALVASGSSFGIMVLYPVNYNLTKLAGWRSTILLHSGLLGLIFFIGMAFRPLLSLNITKAEDDEHVQPSVMSIKRSPSLISASMTKQSKSLISIAISTPTRTERLLSAVSNSYYPTASAAMNSVTEDFGSAQPGTSSYARRVSRFTIKTSAPPEAMAHWQLKLVQSNTDENKYIQGLHDNEHEIPHKKPSCWSCIRHLCHWDPHTSEGRPMYRDDAFYGGKREDLEVYQKSLVDTTTEGRTGLEYHMAVSRAVDVQDLNERRGVFTTATRRVLATMINPNLLKRYSFLLICLSGFMTYLGYLVPFVYLQDRNLKGGIDPKHCSFLVSAMALCSAIGRVVIGCLASKIDPLRIFGTLYTVAGLSTILSTFSYNLYFQYTYSCLYGFCIASSTLRSIIFVSLYGLDKLTNATGMLFIFLGLGTLVSTPMASVLKNTFGYRIAFVAAGIFITISGLLLIPVKALALRNK